MLNTTVIPSANSASPPTLLRLNCPSGGSSAWLSAYRNNSTDKGELVKCNKRIEGRKKMRDQGRNHQAWDDHLG